MKVLLTLLAILVLQSVNATNYYFSTTSGDDNRTSAQAQNPGTPWKSIAKLNAIFGSLRPGDQVLFQRGDVFSGTINVSQSGAPGAPIVIGSFGSGNKPVINGFTVLSAWEFVGNGIYQSVCTNCQPSGNMVTINDIPQALGRYPNNSYLTIDAHSGVNSITDYQLTGTPNWTGAEVVLKKARWIIDRNVITNHSGNTINYANSSNYEGRDNFGYFIQNDFRTLDLFGEWYFDKATRKIQMHFGGNNPNFYKVKASNTDILFNISGFHYITLTDLAIEGANQHAIQITNSNNISVLNCDISNSGADGITAIHSNSLRVENTSVNYTNSNGIQTDDRSGGLVVRNSVITNTGLFAGMGRSWDGSYIALKTEGSDAVCEYNRIEHTGYIGIYFKGNNLLLKNNFINRSCIHKDDGGGIYTYTALGEAKQYNRKITGNIVMNSVGAGAGTSSPTESQAEGIYLDGETDNVEISYNTVANCKDHGIQLYGSNNIQVIENTVYNNKHQFNIFNYGGRGIRGLNVQRNIFFSKTTAQQSWRFYSLVNDLEYYGVSDNNRLARLFDDELLQHTYNTTVDDYLGRPFTLAGWRALYNQDWNSTVMAKASPSYTYDVVGANKFPNGNFDNNVSDMDFSGCDRSWSSGGGLDGGALQVTPWSATSPGKIALNVGAVRSDKKYVLRFSSKAVRANGNLRVFVLQRNSPWSIITPIQFIPINNIRKENEIILSPSVTDGSVQLVLQFNKADETVWIDNLQFHEANVTEKNPDDYVRFEYNASTSPKTIALDRTYTDAKNATYANSVTLAPYTSMVLVASSQGAPPPPPPIVDVTPPVITPRNITINTDASGLASIQPSDIIQSITDNSAVDNSSIQISQSQFGCSAVPPPTGSRQAFVATQTTGTQNFGGELGMEFRVNTSIVVNQLGAFDHQGNGILGTINGGVRVAIFNKATRTIVPGLDATIAGNADAYSGNHRMKNISPVTLLPGDYVVVTKGYNANELNGNSAGGTPFPAGDLGNGAITYTGTGLYGFGASGFDYPSNPDGGPGNRYLAGTFSYGGTSTVPPSTVNRQAFVATQTTGTQNFGGELGMEFRVNTSIVVNQLGAFDHQGNGILGTINGGVRVAIFNKATRTIVPGLDATIAGNADAYSGNHRMKNISPVTLLPGDYVVVTKGYNANELNGNSAGGTPFPAGDLGNGAITYTGTGLYGFGASGFDYPSNPDGGPGNRYLAGTFSYGGTSTVPPSTVNRQAFVATQTTGTQNFGGELGMEFRVNTSIVVNQLGAFDHQGNGILGTINGGVRVAIFNKATRTIVPGLDATIAGNADAYSGNHRMKNISPVTLLPGDYVVVTKGYNANELNGNSAGGTPFPAGDLGNGAITYTGTGLYGSAGSGFDYPSNPDGGPGNRYLAGTFSYGGTSSTPVAAPTGSSSTYSVRITAKDIHGNQGEAIAIVTVICNATGASANLSADTEEAAAALQPAAEIATTGLTLYPNPSSGQFTMQLTAEGQTSQTRVEIYTEKGDLVLSKSLSAANSAGSRQMQFDLSNQASGLYFVKVITGDKMVMGKMILRK